jgi:hypothetical protein
MGENRVKLRAGLITVMKFPFPFYANQCFFQSRLLPKTSQLKLYCSIIRQTVTYVCEALDLKGTIKKQEAFKDEAQTALFKDPVRTAL